MEGFRNVSKLAPKRRTCVLGSLVAITLALGASGDVLAQTVSPDQPMQLSPEPAKPHRAPKRHAKPVRPNHIAAGSPQAAVSQPAAAPAALLPNGASSITESYGDWTVNCRIDNGEKICVISQALGNRQTGQRAFAIELRSPKNGKTEGTILMPFGLKLENGATLKLDDRDLGKGLRFSTCVPDGCLLSVSFPTIATDAMKTAKALTVAALNLSTNDPVSFNVSLNGFAAALARVTNLAK